MKAEGYEAALRDSATAEDLHEAMAHALDDPEVGPADTGRLVEVHGERLKRLWWRRREWREMPDFEDKPDQLRPQFFFYGRVEVCYEPALPVAGFAGYVAAYREKQLVGDKVKWTRDSPPAPQEALEALFAAERARGIGEGVRSPGMG